MDAHAFVLTDQARAEQFALLGHACRPFRGRETFVDAQGVAWAVARLGGHALAATWLGPGWVFDPALRQRRSEEFAARRGAMSQADPERHARELEKVINKVRLGGHAERILWAVRRQVRTTRCSVVDLMDGWLAGTVWGAGGRARPRHWRKELLEALLGLTWLHLAEWPEGGPTPEFGEGTALLASVGDLRNDPASDVCDDHCPGRHGPAHHHYRVSIGRGFLGALERLAGSDDGSGVRAYTFPDGAEAGGAGLRALGKTGRLLSVYLPAKLGDPAACARLDARRHRLLQALVRETTRARRGPGGRRGGPARPEVFSGNKIVGYAGKGSLECGALDDAARYVGFNGNGVRRGQGYRLATGGGWTAKAGYGPDEVGAFLDDLASLARSLSLTAVGVGGHSRIVSLDEMRALSSDRRGLRTLERLHVRVYAPSDYLDRWGGFFAGDRPEGSRTPGEADALAAVSAALKAKKISRRRLAARVGVDPSFLGKVLDGKRPCPEGLLARMEGCVAGQTARPPRPPAARRPRETKEGEKVSVLQEALGLIDRGWSVVPQMPGQKKPCVKWKPFQVRLPTREEVVAWFDRWPDAGLALVLGPVSGVFVLDVDGEEAHDALLERLGREPVAPKALSGSGKPHRYHLYFRCPDLPTRAKATPWHPNLEYRGQGGIVVIPPSLHKSGNRYVWEPGRSPDEVELPAVPPQVLEALRPVRPARTRAGNGVAPIVPVAGVDAGPRTLEFLSGRWAEGSGWNAKLYSAACDLCGRGMDREDAEPLLLAGARPWGAAEEEQAVRTIASAYARPREPARL